MVRYRAGRAEASGTRDDRTSLAEAHANGTGDTTVRSKP